MCLNTYMEGIFKYQLSRAHFDSFGGYITEFIVLQSPWKRSRENNHARAERGHVSCSSALGHSLQTCTPIKIKSEQFL